MRCLYAVATPWTAAYTSPTLLWSHRNVRYSLALTFSCFSLTFKCLRNRLVGFFDSSLAKAGTFRSRQGVFFSKVVKNTHCSSRANLHHVDTSTQPPLRMRENTLNLCHLFCAVALGPHEIACMIMMLARISCFRVFTPNSAEGFHFSAFHYISCSIYILREINLSLHSVTYIARCLASV